MGVLRNANYKNAETSNYHQHIDRIPGVTLLTHVIEKYKKPMSTRVRIHCGFQTLWQYDNYALLFGLKVINILMGDLYTQCEII